MRRKSVCKNHLQVSENLEIYIYLPRPHSIRHNISAQKYTFPNSVLLLLTCTRNEKLICQKRTMNNSFFRHFRSSLHTRIRYSTTAIPIIIPTTTSIATTASTTTFSQSLSSSSSSSSSSTTTDTNNKPEKLSEEAVKASLRLLSYQGTPFPWVEVSYSFIQKYIVIVGIWPCDVMGGLLRFMELN